MSNLYLKFDLSLWLSIHCLRFACVQLVPLLHQSRYFFFFQKYNLLENPTFIKWNVWCHSKNKKLNALNLVLLRLLCDIIWNGSHLLRPMCTQNKNFMEKYAVWHVWNIINRKKWFVTIATHKTIFIAFTFCFQFNTFLTKRKCIFIWKSPFSAFFSIFNMNRTFFFIPELPYRFTDLFFFTIKNSSIVLRGFFIEMNGNIFLYKNRKYVL